MTQHRCFPYFTLETYDYLRGRYYLPFTDENETWREYPTTKVLQLDLNSVLILQLMHAQCHVHSYQASAPP